MKIRKNVTVIIPCFNEMRTVGSVIEIARAWNPAGQTIVINDGSTDNTAGVLAPFRKYIHIITHRKNLGKGSALASGLAKTTGDYIVLLDADTCGLTIHAIDKLIQPVVQGKADMTLGIVRFFRLPDGKISGGISGFRALRSSDFLPHLKKLKGSGYGVEWLINDLYRHRKVVSVELPNVYILDKFLKVPKISTVLSYVKTGREMFGYALRAVIQKRYIHAKR